MLPPFGQKFQRGQHSSSHHKDLSLNQQGKFILCVCFGEDMTPFNRPLNGPVIIYQYHTRGSSFVPQYVLPLLLEELGDVSLLPLLPEELADEDEEDEQGLLLPLLLELEEPDEVEQGLLLPLLPELEELDEDGEDPLLLPFDELGELPLLLLLLVVGDGLLLLLFDGELSPELLDALESVAAALAIKTIKRK
jgi:hypothetical protein